MKPIYPLLIACLLALASCRRLGLCHHAEFVTQKTPYTGSQLRTDGYYYSQNSDTGYMGVVRREVLIFYRNGIAMFPGSPKEDSMDHYVSQDFRSDVVGHWGLYTINGTTITMEKWIPVYAGCRPTALSTGQILNDTSFVLTKFEKRKYRGEPEIHETNELYIFRQFGHKPDSTNDIIN